MIILHLFWVRFHRSFNDLFNLSLILDLNPTLFFYNIDWIFPGSIHLFKDILRDFSTDRSLFNHGKHLCQVFGGHRTLIDLPFIALQLTEEISHDPVAYRFWLWEKTDTFFKIIGHRYCRGKYLRIILGKLILPNKSLLFLVWKFW